MPPTPTVPSRRRPGLERRDDPLRAVSSGAEPGALHHAPGSVRTPGDVLWVPRGLPVRAEALAVRRSADLETLWVPCSRLRITFAEASVSLRRDPWPKPRFCLDASSGRSPWSRPGRHWRRSTAAVLRDRGRSLSPGVASKPESSVAVGALRNLPLSHPLKGKPAASAWRRLRQPPGLRVVATPLWGGRPVSLRLWLGRRLVRLRSIVSATDRSCHENRRPPSTNRLWIMRITGITGIK